MRLAVLVRQNKLNSNKVVSIEAEVFQLSYDFAGFAGPNIHQLRATARHFGAVMEFRPGS
jgi:hypothetical protein